MAEVIIKIKGYKCERCGHEWAPRSEEIPIICPKCKSPYWNRAKKVQRYAGVMQNDAGKRQ